MDPNQGLDNTGTTGYNEPHNPQQAARIGQDLGGLSSVRSGDLQPGEPRQPIQPLEDSTAISEKRELPRGEISAIVSKYLHVDPMEAMIPVLQEMQVKFGYITQDAAQQISEELGLAAAEVYGVLTFYSFFRYSPRAGHVIMSCEGTGCYVLGAAKVREAIENRLNVGPGDTSADGKFTFEPQSICLGACDLGPLVEIEGTYYAQVTPEKMNAIIDQWYDESEDEKPLGDNLTGGHRLHYEENYGFGPTVDELYEGYDVARYMPAGAGAAAAATQAPTGVEQATQTTPPTPGTGGGASGAKSKS